MVRLRAATGDTFDFLAFIAYGDETRAHVLMSANPQYLDRSVFHGGEILIVPEPEEPRPSSLPPWKRGE